MSATLLAADASGLVALIPDAKGKSHAYRVAALRRVPGGWAARLERDGGPGYDLVCTRGRWSCSCPDWRYRGRLRPDCDCKHTLALRRLAAALARLL